MAQRRLITEPKKAKTKESWFKRHKEKNEFISWLKIAPYKRIIDNKGQYIELADDRGYMQIFEIPGKDIDGLGEEEKQNTLVNYNTWLVQFQYGFSFYLTKLPTNTQKQIEYLQLCLYRNKQDLKKTSNPRIKAQLQDKIAILESNIQTEKQIQKEIYNSEFLLFLFGRSIKELDDITYKATSYGNMDFIPKVVTKDKKEQILEQFNNMNEKL